jgi:hypothetical protein
MSRKKKRRNPMNQNLKTAIEKHRDHKPISEMTTGEYQEYRLGCQNIAYMLEKEHDKK